jgi:hypothetical protein
MVVAAAVEHALATLTFFQPSRSQVWFDQQLQFRTPSTRHYWHGELASPRQHPPVRVQQTINSRKMPIEQHRAPSSPVAAATQLLSLVLLLFIPSAAAAASVTAAGAKRPFTAANGSRCKLNIQGDLSSGNITAASLSCTEPGITAGVHPLLRQHLGNASGVTRRPADCGAVPDDSLPCLIVVCDAAYALFDAPVISGFTASNNLQYALCVTLGSNVRVVQGCFFGNAAGSIAADNSTLIVVNSTFRDNAMLGEAPYRPGLTAFGPAVISVVSSLFVNNSGNAYGLAIGAGDAVQLSVTSCAFSRNRPSPGCFNCFPGVIMLAAKAQGMLRSLPYRRSSCQAATTARSVTPAPSQLFVRQALQSLDAPGAKLQSAAHIILPGGQWHLSCFGPQDVLPGPVHMAGYNMLPGPVHIAGYSLGMLQPASTIRPLSSELNVALRHQWCCLIQVSLTEPLFVCICACSKHHILLVHRQQGKCFDAHGFFSAASQRLSLFRQFSSD